ncbi:MAG TPA: RNA polymerase sigma factor [Pseudonocardiaceae bacterium]|nr:RNA polymerase sigma factor [Pseudonocardiaceae bacterium]
MRDGPEPTERDRAAAHRQPPTVDLSTALRRAQAGDEAAFTVLYRAIQPGLLRYLRALVGEDAEDTASEAWLQIASGLASFRGDIDGFRGWTTTIARNRAMDSLRKRYRRPTADQPVDLLTTLPGRDDTAGAAVEAVTTDAALALIARLPPDQAEAVLLRVVVGLDAATAGRVLGKRPGAVRTAAYRGLRTLAGYLAAQDRRADPAHRSAAGVTQPTASTLKDMR